MKKYYYEDLRAMSQAAREIWICDQCSEFGREIEKLMCDRERENFAEEMHRKLRQISKRWTSWNHKIFGNITSRTSVNDLLSWEQNTKLLVNPALKTGNITPEQNILVTFQELCEKFTELHESFTNDVLEPMFDFFHPSAQNATLDNIVTNLRELLSHWKGLLEPGDIDQTLFSEPSAKYLNVCLLRGRMFNYDAVIRLVPDLLEKSYAALGLARKWRLLYKEFCITREGTYTLLGSHKVSKKERQRPRSMDIYQLEKQSDEVKTHCKSIELELSKCEEKCESLEKDLGFYTEECQKLEDEVAKTKQVCDEVKQKLEQAKKDNENTSDCLSGSQQYCQVLQQQLNSSKIKYCTQKIKLINAKKRCVTLADQTGRARHDYEALLKESEISQKKDQILRNQIEVFRNNIKTQASMVDSLQQQCYTLKKELDKSTASCETMTGDLSETQARCDALEANLQWSEEERDRLKDELEKAVIREKVLRRENAELSENLTDKKAEELPSEEACNLNTPVER